ncbi:kinase-like protein [Sistotremastrum niveocremeum HHB9708]|uniref:Kinase-like protein n=1 Tax=Sistotremastrum niveocremeum HHB9708 TaxID=1314777 RepID=A0A164QMC4_9AGAM|nr:kinase-like protein [Sistotremastrum niveocremeum HHB9708]
MLESFSSAISRRSKTTRPKFPSEYDRHSETQDTLARTTQDHINMMDDPDFLTTYGPDVASARERTMCSLGQLRLQDRKASSDKEKQRIDQVFTVTQQSVWDIGIEVTSTKRALLNRKGQHTLPCQEGTIYYKSETNAAGGFGVVRKAWFEPNDTSSVKSRYIAMKTAKVEDEDVEAVRRQALREAAIWRSLRHENINPFFDMFETTLPGDELPVVTLLSPWADPLCPGAQDATASSFLREISNCEHTLTILSGILEGLRYMHELPDAVYHGDLKGNNVLLFGTPRNPVAKLTDFGLSKICSPIPNGATKVGGNVFWTAPEIARWVEDASEEIGHAERAKRTLTAEADVWGFGMTAFELITRARPMRERDHLGISLSILYAESSEYIDEELAEYLDCIPNLLRSFLASCLTADPSKRPSVSELKKRWDSLVAEPQGPASMPWPELLKTVPPAHSIYYPPTNPGALDQIASWRNSAKPRRDARKAKYKLVTLKA